MGEFQGYLVTAVVTLAGVVTKLYYAQQAMSAEQSKLLVEKARLEANIEHLTAENSRFREQLNLESDDTEEAVVTMSFSGVICSWSYAAQRLLGWRSSEILGRPATLLMTAEDADRHQAAVQKLHETHASRSTVADQGSLGKTRIVSAVTKLNQTIRLAIVVGVLDDPTHSPLLYAVMRRADR